MATITDQQIRETVAAMRMNDTHKAILIRQAIEDRNPSALFVVTNAWKRGTNVPPYEQRKAMREATLKVGRE